MRVLAVRGNQVRQHGRVAERDVRRFDREEQIDGVFRQHCHKRQSRQRQAGGYLRLRNLRTPRQERRRGEDADPEDQRLYERFETEMHRARQLQDSDQR